MPRPRPGKARPRRLVSIIFSLLFLVVQWAFSSLSPRLNLFRDDPIVWRTFGLAVGVLVFSVTAALVIGNDPEVPVIVPAAEVAGVLAALALIRSLQVKAFASIQLAPTLSAIAARGRGILDDLYPRPAPDSRPPGAPLPPLRRAITWPHQQAILQQLDVRRGLNLLEFLLRTETRDGHLSVTPVGGRGRDDAGPDYDQQPIEVSALADACGSAFRITRQSSWLTGVSLAWDWFGGGNDSATPMFDPRTDGGYDDLERRGRNLNQGAESTLAMLATAQQARRIGALE